MNLTKEEKNYYDSFSAVYKKYGENIPSQEWDYLSQVRKSLDIGIQRSKQIIEVVQRHEEVSVVETENDKSPVSIFKGGIMPLINRANGTDCLILNISDSTKSIVRSNFGLGLDETILWVRDTSFWGNLNQGLVITDQQIVLIPDNDHPENRNVISFNDLHHAEYREMAIFVWNYQNEYLRIHLSYFFKSVEESQELIQDAQLLAQTLTKVGESMGHTETKTVFDEMSDLLSEGKYDEVENNAKQIVSDSTNDNDARCIAYMYLSEALLQKGKTVNVGDNSDLRDAVSACEEALSLCESEDPYVYSIYNQKGKIEQVANEKRVARNCFIAAMETSDFDLKKEVKDSYEQLTNELGRDERAFLNKEYNDRKFLFIVNSDKQIPGCYDKDDNVQWVFPLNQIPAYINFPLGHPQPNTLYIGHPLKPGLYIPFENATEQLFMEKVRELCYLAQCLGAVEIKFKRIKGQDISSQEVAELERSGEAGRKFFNVGGSIDGSTSEQNTYSSKDGVELVQKYSPIKKPFCPDGMIWYDSDSTWQTLVKQRLNGNILSYVERVSSTETTTVSTSQLIAVKGSFEYLFAKANGGYEAKNDKTFSKTEELEWEINIQFKPLQEFGESLSLNQMLSEKVQDANDELSEDELAYKEEVEFCLEDETQIDAHSRKFLERKRQKLGLSEMRAQEIEAMVLDSLKSFTDEEKEYMEALGDVIENGVVPDNVRRLLAREMKSLGLTEERARELEEIKCKEK